MAASRLTKGGVASRRAVACNASAEGADSPTDGAVPLPAVDAAQWKEPARSTPGDR